MSRFNSKKTRQTFVVLLDLQSPQSPVCLKFKLRANDTDDQSKSSNSDVLIGLPDQWPSPPRLRQIVGQGNLAGNLEMKNYENENLLLHVLINDCVYNTI